LFAKSKTYKQKLELKQKKVKKMPEIDELQFCATKIERTKLKALKDIAFSKRMHLKDLLRQILTDYANSHGANA
jgi:hypothetical protein